ncbi:hypothetical protein TVAG_158340 [Trichomonas vaginalis G3]|uniref:Uncharacterized protein n=1 Tax=Trichomonas vaginalis (strain ATCC PRA-98 / G3) TaxID=412133 RepID=A2FP45_TRIV3|nr:hypothetical protein TVAGG3_0500610 [Trichomonas vaginalis G3]EAX93315.1 hypothetical protein TVAG_158340 [Trichomonas vaginalis G3]KAI5517048.1 hypothetical protein TVAGG3_0500610 [Trichomonas vaginalis G3]|eukprot:XP_001306245.1 hypothetical protein [Trichomonas vaginalis G3]
MRPLTYRPHTSIRSISPIIINNNLRPLSALTNSNERLVPSARTVRTIVAPRMIKNTCVEMKSSADSFSLLTKSYKFFMNKLPDGIFTDFSLQFQELSENFKKFHSLTVSQLDSRRAKTSLSKLNQDRKNTNLSKHANKLTKKLEEFAVSAHSINASGTTRYYELMQEGFQFLFESLDTIKKSISGCRTTQDKSMVKYNQLYAIAFHAKKTVDDTFALPASKRFDNFDFQTFKNSMIQITSLAISILSKGIPLRLTSSYQIANLRSTISTSCLTISNLMESSLCFQDDITHLRSCLIDFTNHLKFIFEKLCLPFDVNFNFEKFKTLNAEDLVEDEASINYDMNS